MPTRYVLLTLAVKEEDTDVAIGVLSRYPLIGVEMGIDSATVCFDHSEWEEEFATSIVGELSSVGVDSHVILVGTEEDQNWNAEWEAAIDPVIVNERIAIVPEWKSDKVAAEIKLIISPKMSFGTGHHATTRMMCRLVEQYVEPGSVWTDVGTGTGVLAILAVKLGASHVFAFDNNEWSVLNARENIVRNECEECITLEQIDLASTTLPLSNGLAANLYRHLVIPNAERFVNAIDNKGVILVSGILTYDFDEVVAPFLALGCTIETRLNESEWCAIAIRVPGSRFLVPSS